MERGVLGIDGGVVFRIRHRAVQLLSGAAGNRSLAAVVAFRTQNRGAGGDFHCGRAAQFELPAMDRGGAERGRRDGDEPDRRAAVAERIGLAGPDSGQLFGLRYRGNRDDQNDAGQVGDARISRHRGALLRAARILYAPGAGAEKRSPAAADRRGAVFGRVVRGDDLHLRLFRVDRRGVRQHHSGEPGHYFRGARCGTVTLWLRPAGAARGAQGVDPAVPDGGGDGGRDVPLYFYARNRMQ